MNSLRTLLSYPLLVAWALAPMLPAQAQSQQWYKGNLHTHSLWSDGDQFPEFIMAWYKEHGYHFVGLSDHNILAQHAKWVDIPPESPLKPVFDRYLETYGEDWVEHFMVGDTVKVQLKTFNQYRPLFEESGSFMIFQSEEITDGFEGKPIHINATNVRELIMPRSGSSVVDVMQRNIDAVMQQRARTGQPMFAHINHPNFGWAITAEDIKQLDNERFFEVYNGHPAVHNEGDATRSSTEDMWDEVLLHYLINDKPPIWGLAVDDSHNYHQQSSQHSNPGRGWVMVRSESLTPDAIVEALERGDFYSSTGVTFKKLSLSPQKLQIRIQAEPGVTYETLIIGARKGGQPEVLATFKGPKVKYKLAGDEWYVRAKVISSKLHPNPYQPGDLEVAWTQPIVP